MSVKQDNRKKQSAPTPRRVLLVTGLSGAGLSTTLSVLEDLEWNVVDNLPLSLVPALLADEKGSDRPVAIGVDGRTWDFSAEKLFAVLDSLRADLAVQAELAFIDCENAILHQRFTETRRRHPLAIDRPVADGIAENRRQMEDVRSAAHYILDTTDLTVHDLRRHMSGQFALHTAHGLLVFVQSFGFKNGVPRDADLVFDVRFLVNPHWHAKLRPLTGQDARVVKKVKSDKDYATFFNNLTNMLDDVLPRYHEEGKNYLTIAIGCTGGKHRSVVTAEDLCAYLDDQGFSTAIRHRDMPVQKKRRTRLASGS